MRIVVHDTRTGHVRLHTGATASLSCPSYSPSTGGGVVLLQRVQGSATTCTVSRETKG
jgi:hypothetical protein